MLDDACRHKCQPHTSLSGGCSTFQEILDSSSGNSARMKSMTDLRVLAFAGSTEAKYSSTELNLGDFVSFRLLVGRFFIERV
jgi:hypothetical protein